jgi:cell division protein FtsL
VEEGRVIRPSRLSTPSLVALAFAALLASLSLVTWRQSRALEALADLDRARRERSLAESDRVELDRRIQYLESRGRVVPEARRRLGMHTPDGSEMVLLPGEGT